MAKFRMMEVVLCVAIFAGASGYMLMEGFRCLGAISC